MKYIKLILGIIVFTFIVQYGWTGSVSPPITLWPDYAENGEYSNVSPEFSAIDFSDNTTLATSPSKCSSTEAFNSNGCVPLGNDTSPFVAEFIQTDTDVVLGTSGNIEYPDGTLQNTSPQACSSGEALNTTGCEAFSSSGSGDTTINLLDSGVFQGKYSAIDFVSNLTVSGTGDTATLDVSGVQTGSELYLPNDIPTTDIDIGDRTIYNGDTVGAMGIVATDTGVTYPDNTLQNTSPQACASGEALNTTGCEAIGGGSGGSSDTETMLTSFPMTKMPAGETVDKIMKVPDSDTWTVYAGGITDENFNSPNTTYIKVFDEVQNEKVSITVDRKENINADFSGGYMVIRMINDRSDTVNLSGYVEVIK